MKHKKENNAKIRVLIVDDHKITREGVRFVLQEYQEFQIVGEASNSQQALQAAEDLRPDLIIMDVSLPGVGGVEVTENIRSRNDNIPILAFSMHCEKHYIREMLKAGASGYLSKDCDSEELVKALRTILSGKTYLGESLKKVALEDYVEQHSVQTANSKPRLTHREFQVLKLSADGYSVKEIASQLEKSPKTIEACRRHMMIKLNLDSMAELVKYALREGVTTL